MLTKWIKFGGAISDALYLIFKANYMTIPNKQEQSDMLSAFSERLNITDAIVQSAFISGMTAVIEFMLTKEIEKLKAEKDALTKTAKLCS